MPVLQVMLAQQILAVIVAVAVFGSTQLDTNSIFYFFLVQLKRSCPSDVFEKWPLTMVVVLSLRTL